MATTNATSTCYVQWAPAQLRHTGQHPTNCPCGGRQHGTVPWPGPAATNETGPAAVAQRSRAARRAALLAARRPQPVPASRLPRRPRAEVPYPPAVHEMLYGQPAHEMPTCETCGGAGALRRGGSVRPCPWCQ